MAGEIVVDASVVAKFYFFEPGSERARAFLTSGVVALAPDLLRAEMANIAVKRVRLGLSTREEAHAALGSIDDIVDEFVPLRGLADRSFTIAADSGCSAYDALYLALAVARGAQMLTADQRLVARMQASGLGGVVRPL